MILFKHYLLRCKCVDTPRPGCASVVFDNNFGTCFVTFDVHVGEKQSFISKSQSSRIAKMNLLQVILVSSLCFFLGVQGAIDEYRSKQRGRNLERFPSESKPADQQQGFFRKATSSWLYNVRSLQKSYGVAVSDVDHDGYFDMIVAGYDGPNMVLKYDPATKSLVNIASPGTPFELLMDRPGAAIGVCACDIDGDGKEEIYFLNTNQAYAGHSAYGDKLFKWRNGTYVDLYFDAVNRHVSAKNFAGRSVACVDRQGNGKYAFAVATYSSNGHGKFALIEMDETHEQNNVNQGNIVIRNFASEAGIHRATGGRGIAVGPILHDDGKLDIFFDNEGSSWFENSGANFLFKNQGNGTFKDVAWEAEVADANENGRGITLADFNRDGLLDICYGNWAGPHRLFIQLKDSNTGKRHFIDIASPEFSDPTLVRTVIAADFDNDGNLEVFFNNIDSYRRSQPNKIFRVTSRGIYKDPSIEQLPIGDALEEHGHGTGGAIADFDGDGYLELLISHGESSAQSLELYQVYSEESKNWIRVLPKTKHGAPARGASVFMTTTEGGFQRAVIDSGSGYLCQMEPVAHFGLGSGVAHTITVQWPDGIQFSKTLSFQDMRKTHIIDYPTAHTEE